MTEPRRLRAALPMPRHPAFVGSRCLIAAALVLGSTACGAETAHLSAARPAAHSVAGAAITVGTAPSADGPAAPRHAAPTHAADSTPSKPARPSRSSPRHSSKSGGQRGPRMFHGVLLPNSRRTPGATNAAVTPGTIRSTICVPGWTAQIRPSSSYTTALKERQLAAGYAWHGDTDTGDYEEDHLIPLELGGSPSSPANLWPEPYRDATDTGALSKDSVENSLHALVCSGALGLRTAQQAIARDWWRAGQEHMTAPGAPRRPLASRAAAAHPSSVRPTPAPHSCTLTSSGSCIRGGEFCPKASYGQTGYSADGTAYKCAGDSSRPRWQ